MKKNIITNVKGLEVMDSRGNPTVMAVVTVDDTFEGKAMVPSGASTGSFEAFELRDKGTRFNGNGCLTAVKNVNTVIKDMLIGKCVFDQRAIDSAMIALDATDNKSNLGANALLAVSLACAKAAASALNVPLYRYLGGVNSYRLPVPMMNIINGGKHAENKLSMQEFMIMPVGAKTFAEGLVWCSEVYHTLKKLLKNDGFGVAVGDEGGFAPDFQSEEDALIYIVKAIEKAGYKPGDDFKIALDPATTELYDEAKKIGKEGCYYFWKTDKVLTAKEMIALFSDWCEKYPICSIEDSLAEEDWDNYTDMTNQIGGKIQLVGDDLFVTNVSRLTKGIKLGACNAILVKVNQIGTLSEAMDAIELAHKCGYKAVISHRSGETEDTFIADLAVATGAGQIKTGAPCRSERVAKYNRLLEIEDELNGESTFRINILK